jgi:hypothetical protein
MNDDEIITMILAASVHSKLMVTSVKIRKRTVLVECDGSSLSLKKAALPTKTVGEVARELQRKFGALV